MRAFLLSLAALALLTGNPAAQSDPSVDQLVERMGAYLRDYELLLSSIVADEEFRQRVVEDEALVGDRSGDTGGVSYSARKSTSQTMNSEVAFIRLPGGGDWLGFRDVKKINGKPVETRGAGITELLASDVEPRAKAQAVADAGAKYNLGLPRTINVPTAALEIIHPNHRQAFAYTLQGRDTINRIRTMVVSFVEIGRPTIMREPSGADLISSGRIWIEPAKGTIWKIEWMYQKERRDASAGPPPRLTVEFAPHQELAMMVPIAMQEIFGAGQTFGSNARTVFRGDGRATYDNFRRFGTSARILPPPDQP
jgi:hypothetical protein